MDSEKYESLGNPEDITVAEFFEKVVNLMRDGGQDTVDARLEMKNGTVGLFQVKIVTIERPDT